MYGEAFGLYTVEAMAAGVPIVAPRHASFPEVIEENDSGMLCDPGDFQALAEAIEKLLLDRQLLAELGQNGRQAVQDKFNIQRMAQGYFEVLSKL